MTWSARKAARRCSNFGLLRRQSLRLVLLMPVRSDGPNAHGPCAVVAHEHWRVDFAAARTGSCVDITLEEAVVAVNSWVDQIAEAM